MPVEQIKNNISLVAGADLSAKEYCFVKLSANNTVVLCGAGEAPVGVLDNAPASGEAAAISISGQVRVLVGSTVTYGQKVKSDANGKVAPALATDTNIVGTVIEGAATGSMCSIMLDRYYQRMEMSDYTDELRVSVVAGVGGTTSKLLVKQSAVAGKVITAGSGETVVGVALTTVLADAAVQIQIAGVATVTSGAAVTAGGLVECNAAGKAITFTGTQDHRAIGVATTTVGGADLDLSIMLLPLGWEQDLPDQLSQALVAGAGGTTEKLFVKQSAVAGKVIIAGSGEAAIGIAAATVIADAAVSFYFGGKRVVTSGAAVTAGDLIECNAAGKAITYSGTAGHQILGVALSTVGGADLNLDVILLPFTRDTAVPDQLKVGLLAGVGGTTTKLFVKASAVAGKVVICSAAGEAAVGIAQATVIADAAVDVAFAGRRTVTSGAAVNAGALIETNAAGKAVTSTGADDHRVLGVALSTVGGADLDLDILLFPNGGWETAVATELEETFVAGAGGTTVKEFVKADAVAGQVVAAVAGDRVVGVAMATVLAAASIDVQFAGKVTCDSGAAITAGDLLEVDATGRPIPASGIAGRFVVSQALSTVVGVGLDVDVMLLPQYPQTGTVETRLFNSWRQITVPGWAPTLTGAPFLADTLAAKTMRIDLTDLKVGERINKFRIAGALGASAGNHTVVDAALRKTTKGAGAVVDSLVDAIAQVDVVADTALDSEETIGGGPEVVATDYQYYVLVTATTAADPTCDIELTGVELDLI